MNVRDRPDRTFFLLPRAAAGSSPAGSERTGHGRDEATLTWGASGGQNMMLKMAAMSAALLALSPGTETTVETGQHAKGTFEVKVTPVPGTEQSVASSHLT